MPLPAPQDYTGRAAIISGAARGPGRAVAERLHERGASVAINVRDAERAERVAREIGERAFAVPGDRCSGLRPNFGLPRESQDDRLAPCPP